MLVPAAILSSRDTPERLPRILERMCDSGHLRGPAEKMRTTRQERAGSAAALAMSHGTRPWRVSCAQIPLWPGSRRTPRHDVDRHPSRAL